MRKLKSLLLASAVIPALVVTPMQASFAQAPDQERPGHGPRGEGGMRGGPGHEPGEGPRGGADRKSVV